MPTVQVQQLIERTVGRAPPVENTVELPTLQSDGSEMRVHTTRQQGRCVHAACELCMAFSDNCLLPVMLRFIRTHR